MPTHVIYSSATEDGWVSNYSTISYADAREAGTSRGYNSHFTTSRFGQYYNAADASPWRIDQTFLQWDTTVVPANESIVGAKMRISIYKSPYASELTAEVRHYDWTGSVADMTQWVPASQLESKPLIGTIPLTPVVETEIVEFPGMETYIGASARFGVLIADSRQLANIAPVGDLEYMRPDAGDSLNYDFNPRLVLTTDYVYHKSYPTSIVSSTNLTGAITTIQNDPNVSDGVWMTATDTQASSILHTAFDALPAGQKYDGKQKFTFRARASVSSTSFDVYLYEAGLERALLDSFTIGAEELREIEWSPELLTNPAANSVELRIVQTGGDAVEIESIMFSAWYVDNITYTSTIPAEYTDFTQAWASGAPSGWSEQWNLPTTSRRFPDAEALGGIVVLRESSSSARRCLAWSDKPAATNVDILARLRVERLAFNTARIYTRVSGAGGTEETVFLELYETGSNSYIRIVAYVAGAIDVHFEHAMKLSGRNWYKVRFRVFGERYRAKIWKDGDVEPPWDIDAYIPAIAPKSGMVGLGGFTGYSPVEWDAFSVAFDGEYPIPLPPSPPPRPDDHPPAPAGINLSQVGNDVRIAWEPVADVSGYKVTRDGMVIATTTALEYIDVSPPLGNHRYAVVSYRTV